MQHLDRKTLQMLQDRRSSICSRTLPLHCRAGKDGTSELYSISEFATRTTENVRKGYLVGKYGAIPDIEIEEVE